jgi:methylated-DNA-protein-cysteine methyltransferase-like protein
MGGEALRQVFYTNLASIPSGRYCSYGDMASLCGVHVRQILAWLRRLPAESNLPWYRLITGQRRVADYPGNQKQVQLLSDEGLIPEANGKYPPKYRWPDQID